MWDILDKQRQTKTENWPTLTHLGNTCFFFAWKKEPKVLWIISTWKLSRERGTYRKWWFRKSEIPGPIELDTSALGESISASPFTSFNITVSYPRFKVAGLKLFNVLVFLRFILLYKIGGSGKWMNMDPFWRLSSNRAPLSLSSIATASWKRAGCSKPATMGTLSCISFLLLFRVSRRKLRRNG